MKYNNFIKNWSHYGDILAIPFFALLVIYFYNIEHKSIIEYLLLYFSISGFILDIIYTYIFLSSFKKEEYTMEDVPQCPPISNILRFGFIYSFKIGNEFSFQ